MTAFTILRPIFVLFQLGLATYFIFDAYNDWNETPIVSSVSVKSVTNETFPAVTICYANDWKWPGILKASTKLIQDQNFYFPSEFPDYRKDDSRGKPYYDELYMKYNMHLPSQLPTESF